MKSKQRINGQATGRRAFIHLVPQPSVFHIPADFNSDFDIVISDDEHLLLCSEMKYTTRLSAYGKFNYMGSANPIG